MDSQDFYNMFAGSGAAIQSPASIMQNVNLENELGTMQKPPKLMSLDEYSGWSERFKNWVQANHFECWMKIKKKYVPPVDGLRMVKHIGSFTDTEQTDFKAEKKMVSILQQAIKEDILVLLQHDESSQSIWQALELKFKGSASMIKSKKALIKKEFDIFTGIKGESTKQLIERYCHLIKKMNSASMQQDVSLYYKGSPSVANLQSPKIHTRFSADNTSNVASSSHQSSSSTPFASFEPNVKVQEQSSPQSSTGSNHQAYISGVQCNIAVNIKNGNEITKAAAKQHIALLASVLEAYEGLVAGKIGNPDMTKEDYDQIDPEELELIDIKWGMASLVRRAQRFMEITGRNSLSGPDQKLGFDKSKVAAGFSWDKYIPGKDDQVMMAEVVEISEVVSEPEIVDEVVSEVVEEIPTESYFEKPRTGSCPRFEEKKEAVEEVIDVSKEMTGEVLKDIADKALMGKLKEVLDDESEKSEKANSKKVVSDSEDEGNFLDRYNVKFENVEKVFKLVELNVNEINNNEFFSKLKKSFGTSRPTSSEKKDGVGKGQNKKNQFKNKGIGFEKKMAKQMFKPKEKINDVFVAGPSTDVEKDYTFSQKAVDDFNAAQKLKEETVNTTFVEHDKRVCYRYNEIGHMAKQCQKVFKKHVVEKPVQKQMFEKPKSWIVKSKPSIEVKKMENALKIDSNLFKDDVVDFENVDQFLDEFPPITSKVKTIKKKKVPNVIFDFPKTNEKCDVVFGSVSEGLPKSILSRWIMDSGASRHMTGTLALLYDVKSINGSYVGFAGNQGGRIVGQGTLTNGVISFDKVSNVVFDPLHNSCCDLDAEKYPELCTDLILNASGRMPSMMSTIKLISLVVEVHGKLEKILVTEALIHEVINFPDDADSPMRFPERMVKGCMLRMGYQGALNAANYLKLLVHCIC
ncbi:uncharacterized protein LOC110932524 [Helianthus annuus]|uniref:uncharacterized protein LOC110932524 n=1 Tax=Helianthus annuus TaxID=4232 RepID=UPI000B8F7AAF|nr:uncharacterized protein LOC110932524 [Helianthus annuus]